MSGCVTNYARQPVRWACFSVRKLGMADALGIMVALVALTWLPGVMDPASFPKLLVLTAGGLALIPATIDRWSRLARPAWQVLVPVGATLLLLVWLVVSTIASDAPWSVRLFGWWVRADGALGLLAAFVIFLAATTLTRREVQRTVDWLIGGAALAAGFGVPQFFNSSFLQADPGAVVSTLGQINFTGAYFAMMAPLALARAFSAPTRRWRIATGVIAAVLAVMAFASSSLQGPMALAAGAAGFAMARVLMYRGRHRLALTASTVFVFCAGLVVAILGMLAIGPLGFVGREANTIWRYAMWDAGWQTIAGHPLLGIGPGSFARFISEFRPLETVIVAGEGMRPSAVHSIPIQFGIVLGWPGLLLWLIVFLGVAVALVVLMSRRSLPSWPLVAGVAGAFLAYLTQAVVSIDVPSILAVGWLLAGLALALVRCSDRPDTETAPKGKAARVTVPAIVLGVIGAIAVGGQIFASEQVRTVGSWEKAVGVMTDSSIPCPLRLQVANEALRGQPMELALQAVQQATAVDPRCPPIVNLQSQIAVEAKALPLAESSTRLGVLLDPMSPYAWQLRADYLELAGDTVGARGADAEAKRIQDAIDAG